LNGKIWQSRGWHLKLVLYEKLFTFRCFGNLGVTPIDSRDEKGRQRFLAFSPDDHYFGIVTSQWTFDKINSTVSAMQGN
jgi:hypothetical protein